MPEIWASRIYDRSFNGLFLLAYHFLSVELF